MPKKPKNPPRAPGQTANRVLVNGCLEALDDVVPLGKHELEWEPRLGDLRADGLLDLIVDGQHVRYVVEAKRALRRNLIGPLTHLARQVGDLGERLLVCAERIPDDLGEELRDSGVAYLDLGGNAYLHGPGLYVHIAGRRPATTTQRRGKLTRTVVRLLGVFLRDDDAGEAVQTDLAERAGIALGAVGTARKKLVELGVVELGGPRRWRVADREKGLRLFAEGWAATRHHLNPRKFRRLETGNRVDLEQQLAEQGAELECLLGGERAAARLTQWLRTEHATLHVPADKQEAAVRALALVPDRNGPITLLERYGTGDAYEHADAGGIPFAHPLLVWAECLTIPDERVAQTAERVHEGFLKRDDD